MCKLFELWESKSWRQDYMWAWFDIASSGTISRAHQIGGFVLQCHCRPAEGIALLCNCSMISSKGVVVQLFDRAIVQWLVQGRVKFVIVCKGCAIVLLLVPRFKKEHLFVQKAAKVMKYCVLQFDHAQECVCNKFCQQWQRFGWCFKDTKRAVQDK